MVKITSPVPQYVIDWLASFWSQTLFDRLWQLFLIVLFGTILLLALSSSIGFVTAAAGVVFSYLLADDIRQIVADVWNRDFWVWRV